MARSQSEETTLESATDGDYTENARSTGGKKSTLFGYVWLLMKLTAAKRWINKRLNVLKSSKQPSKKILLLLLAVHHWLVLDWYPNIKPVKEFLNCWMDGIDIPDAKSWWAKVANKVDHFLSNYVLIAVILLLGFAISSVSVGIVIPLGLFWLLSKLSKNGPCFFAGYEIQLSHLYIVAAIITFPQWFFAFFDILNAMQSAIIYSVLIALLHATFHKAPDPVAEENETD